MQFFSNFDAKCETLPSHSNTNQLSLMFISDLMTFMSWTETCSIYNNTLNWDSLNKHSYGLFMDINVFLLYTGLKSFQCIKNHKIVILQKNSHLTCKYLFSYDRSIWRTIIEKTMHLPHSQIMLFRPSQYLKSSPLYRNVTPPINSAPIVSIAWRGSCPLNSSFGQESFHMYPCCNFYSYFFCLYCNDGFLGPYRKKVDRKPFPHFPWTRPWKT